jgi:hypothetical protein
MRNYRKRTPVRALIALLAASPALVLPLAATPAHAQISIGFDIRIGYAPPPLPVYTPPPLPAPDYMWVPGHWAWSDWIDDYYWVQGYWIQPPQPGLLWTPAWWGWDHGAFLYHEGYWGHQVGWYGGINYGFGYQGHGWDGGHWDGGHISYNTAVVNVTNVHVTNVYNMPVQAQAGPRVSYNGGAGGVVAQPRPEEVRAMNAPHIAPTPQQQQRVQQAASNPHAAASQMNAGWHPPAVHRVNATGTPIPRAAALAHGGATAGAPPQFQHPGAAAAGAAAPHPTAMTPSGAPAHPGTPAQPGGAQHTAPQAGLAPHANAPGHAEPGVAARPAPQAGMEGMTHAPAGAAPHVAAPAQPHPAPAQMGYPPHAAAPAPEHAAPAYHPAAPAYHPAPPAYHPAAPAPAPHPAPHPAPAPHPNAQQHPHEQHEHP